MARLEADIIARLQREILPLQGFKYSGGTSTSLRLGPINHAFPNKEFPLGAVHEFCCDNTESKTSTGGFVAAILSMIMQNEGAVLWIGPSSNIFPHALKMFGLDPGKIIFVNLQKERDILWAVEEALKCEGLAAVIGEIKEISFTASRRLQLAVEQSRVTGFILRYNPRNLNTTACVTRWKINSIPSMLEDEMPGVGFPRWNVELLKVRNGKPGIWQVEYAGKSFKHLSTILPLQHGQQKKTG